MTLRAQRVRRAGARREASKFTQLLLLLPWLAACSLDDRFLQRAQSGFGSEGGFLQPLDAGSGGASHGTGGRRGSGGAHNKPPYDAAVSADGADSSPSFGADGGCFHTNLDGSPDCDNTIVTNADFNGNIDGWEAFNSGDIAWAPNDSQGANASGAISVINNAPYSDRDGVLVAGATQCMPVASGDAYDFSVMMFIPKDQLPGAVGVLAVWFYSKPNCDGHSLESAYELLASDVVNKWQLATGQGVGVPASDVSMKVLLESKKSFRWADPFEVQFDAIRVVKRAVPF